MSDKPTFWPKNPYPEDIFPMKRERYAEIVPDPDVRTALSGMLGRVFWEIASEEIWNELKEQIEELCPDCFEQWWPSSPYNAGGKNDDP